MLRGSGPSGNLKVLDWKQLDFSEHAVSNLRKSPRLDCRCYCSTNILLQDGFHHRGKFPTPKLLDCIRGIMRHLGHSVSLHYIGHTSQRLEGSEMGSRNLHDIKTTQGSWVTILRYQSSLLIYGRMIRSGLSQGTLQSLQHSRPLIGISRKTHRNLLAGMDDWEKKKTEATATSLIC